MAAPITQRFKASDGFKIAYRHWRAPTPKRVVVCIHGLGDYSGWFRNIAPELAADDSDVYALDLRGFGESPEAGEPRGCVSDFSRHLQDIDDFITDICSHCNEKRVFLFGHSLGGVYSIWYTANHPTKIAGLVLAAPAVTCNINNTYSDQNRDPEEITIMQNDPLETWTLTESYLTNIQQHLLDTALKNACHIQQVPTLILQGLADVTVQPEGAREFYAKLAASDKKIVLLNDAGHWFYDVLSPAVPRSKYDVMKRRRFVSIVKDWLRTH